MSVVKIKPTDKYINNTYIKTSEIVLISEEFYATTGESFLVVRDISHSKVKLNSINTDHITIKSLTDVLILPDIGKIDDEYDELQIGRGACVEFYHALGTWYIVSSDGLKGS